MVVVELHDPETLPEDHEARLRPPFAKVLEHACFLGLKVDPDYVPTRQDRQKARVEEKFDEMEENSCISLQNLHSYA